MGIFRFKKFSVCDDRATMKVGTDAVLLGAWADIENAKTVLDIGTGSGIIALMIAQRTNENVRIDAIEISETDSQQAIENVASSPWRGKVSVINTSLQNFQPETKYDLIVCNPPFFTNSLLPPSKERIAVRHDSQLTFDEILSSAIELLSQKGQLCVILPPTEAELFVRKAHALKLFLNRETKLFTKADKPQERSLLQFGFEHSKPVTTSLLLYAAPTQWSDEYWKLTGDFYLGRPGH